MVRAASSRTGKALEISVGYEPGASLRIAGVEPVGLRRTAGNVLHGRIDPGWTEVVVVTTGEGGDKRGFRLVPSATEATIDHRSFFVRGRFEIAEKADSAARANALWKAAGSR